MLDGRHCQQHAGRGALDGSSASRPAGGSTPSTYRGDLPRPTGPPAHADAAAAVGTGWQRRKPGLDQLARRRAREGGLLQGDGSTDRER